MLLKKINQYLLIQYHLLFKFLFLIFILLHKFILLIMKFNSSLSHKKLKYNLNYFNKLKNILIFIDHQFKIIFKNKILNLYHLLHQINVKILKITIFLVYFYIKLSLNKKMLIYFQLFILIQMNSYKIHNKLYIIIIIYLFFLYKIK